MSQKIPSCTQCFEPVTVTKGGDMGRVWDVRHRDQMMQVETVEIYHGGAARIHASIVRFLDRCHTEPELRVRCDMLGIPFEEVAGVLG